MARKVSKKKRDAAKRAASEDDRQDKRQNSPPAPAQECAMDNDHQDAGCDKFKALALYEETKVMPYEKAHTLHWCSLVRPLRVPVVSGAT